MLTQYTTRTKGLKVIEAQITLHPPYTRLSSLKGHLLIDLFSTTPIKAKR
jgi:hypothetical protein